MMSQLEALRREEQHIAWLKDHSLFLKKEAERLIQQSKALRDHSQELNSSATWLLQKSTIQLKIELGGAIHGFALRRRWRGK